MKEVDVFLLWGTFAKDADWVQEGSKFRSNLEKELYSNGIRANFRVHDWSAENSHSARRASGNVSPVLLAIRIQTMSHLFSLVIVTVALLRTKHRKYYTNAGACELR